MRVWIVGLLCLAMWNAAPVFAQDMAPDEVDAYRAAEQRRTDAWERYVAARIEARKAELDMQAASDEQDSLIKTMRADESFAAPVKRLIQDKQARLADIKRQIGDLAQEVRMAETRIQDMRRQAAGITDRQERMRLLEEVIGEQQSMEARNLHMDLLQDEALRIGQEVLNLGGSTTGVDSKMPAGSGAMFEDSDLAAQLKQYEEQRTQLTFKLRDLIARKNRGEEVGAELQNTAVLLAQLDKLIDQTKRALQGGSTPATEAPSEEQPETTEGMK